MTADLTFGDLIQDFIYRSAPELQITGFPEYGCGDYEGIPIIGQGYQYTLDLEVREIFDTNICLADTGYVIILNNVVNKTDEVDTVYLKEGKAEYSFIPGDASSSFLEENTTSELAMKLSAKVSASLNAWAEVKAGAKFESGFGVMVEKEIWGKLKGSLEVGAAISSQDEFTLTITNGEKFSTSGNSDVTGEEGDVFAGAALNIIYALTDVISYDASTCKVNKSISLSMGADGFATTLSQMASKKTGFILFDDDEGDAFTVDILKDEVYATPVFKVISGTSSCPWEPNTQPREGVQITSDIYLANVDDPNGTAVFHLQLANVSQSEDDMMYNLVFDQGSNPDGAVITLGGSQVQGGIPTPYFIQYGKYNEATVTVRRGPDAFDYDNLQFRFVSGCSDPAIADTLHLDVHFESPCSNISVTKPQENWVVSSLNNNRLKVRIADYDPDLLDFVKIQITAARTSNWLTVLYLDKADLDPTTTETTLLVDQFLDGEYDLRALLECTAGLMYSDIITGGRIDRHGPELFGLPEPADLVLDSGDMITATFNEAINGYKLSASQVNVSNISKNETVPAVAGCNGNVVTVIPDLEDMYCNVMSGTVSWVFVMHADPTPPADADTDHDSIQNSVDNCPWSANRGQEDMDSDTYGDVCDDDVDGDGVLNITDNCLLTSNSDQEDINVDDIGDACQDLTDIVKPAIEGFHFYENYFNPFSEKTTLTYVVPIESHITMKVLDIVGNVIAILMSENVMPGTWEVTWDSKGYNDGIYFCTIYAESIGINDVASKTIKMVKVK